MDSAGGPNTPPQGVGEGAVRQLEQPWKKWHKPNTSAAPVVRHQVMVYEDARNGHAPKDDEPAVVL